MSRGIVSALLLVATLGCATRSAPESAPAAPPDLAAFLAAQGYSRVQMTRLPTGHFQLDGTVDTIRLALIMDTGASHTVLDRERVARLRLALVDELKRAAGLGTVSQQVSTGVIRNITLGPVHLDSLAIAVLDLSHVNTALRTLGVEPIDGIIGADVLVRRHAVIDYASASLYLRAD